MRRALTVALVAGTLTLGLSPTAVAGASTAMLDRPKAPSAVDTWSKPGGSQQDGLASVLRAAVRATVDAGATGMIARVEDGDDVVRVAVGKARLDPPRRIRVTDQVRVGSITKPMVATVALQLVGERRLRLDDTVERWLPGLVPGGDAITVRMLLNHTSGVFDYMSDPDFAAALFADPLRRWSPRELVAVATSHDPLFAPGAAWSYSNTDYVLVGLVLEKVTGKPIETLLDRRVIEPLHLRNTYFPTRSSFRGRYAHGYVPPRFTGGGYDDVSRLSPSFIWTAGAVVSNAPDVARFWTALMSGRLLKPRLLAEMKTTVDTGQGYGYGLGIMAVDTPCGTIWGHNGDMPGYVTFAYTDGVGGRSSVVLLPTVPDEAIFAAMDQVLVTAICQMFDQPIPGGTGGRLGAWRLPSTG
jgi:D-alanyl-D-alanine carboxypeptidase